jgi:hypothetical protein
MKRGLASRRHLVDAELGFFYECYFRWAKYAGLFWISCISGLVKSATNASLGGAAPIAMGLFGSSIF